MFFLLNHADGIAMKKTLATYYYELLAAQGNAQVQYKEGLLLCHADRIAMNTSQAAWYFEFAREYGYEMIKNISVAIQYLNRRSI
jgi:TPR repeat protein